MPVVWNGHGVCGTRKAVANAFKDMHCQQKVESERQHRELRQQLAKAVAELAVATQEVQKLRVLEEEVQKMKELEKEVQKLRMVESLPIALLVFGTW